MKKASIKLSDYFEIINPDYQYIKLVPSSAIKDYDSSCLTIIANQIYKNMMNRITRNEKKIFYEVKSSVKYLISITKTNVQFYYIIPKLYVNLALEAISKAWDGKCTATIVDESEVRILENPTVYEVKYKYEDFMSIKTDSKSNSFLSKALSVVEILEGDDEIQIAINMIPYNRNYMGWRTYYTDMYKKYKMGEPIIKDKTSPSYLIDLLRYFLTDVIDGIIYGLRTTLDKQPNNKEEFRISSNFQEVSQSTKNKKDAGQRLVDTQIFVLSHSESKSRASLNAKAVCNSFNEVRGDNEFIFKKQKNFIGIKKRVWSKNKNIMDAKENANFISIPGQGILDELKCIEHIATHQVPPQEELLTGIVPYGEMTYKGKEFTMYLNENGELAYLPIIVMTKQGGGKSTWFENVGVFLMNNFRRKMLEAKPVKKESLFIIDFIKNCEMSYNIMNNIDAEDIIIIDPKKQGIGFNEVKANMNDIDDILEKSSDQAQEMMKFINAINENAEPLSPKMRRYLNAAFRVCFIHPHQSLKNAIQILEYADIRNKYINDIPEELFEGLSSCVRKLEELDDGNGGTKLNLIQGILDRVGLLEENSILERMYNRDTKDNIDIAKAIQDGKAIFILMPQNQYRTPMSKNILVTYFISKLFLSSVVRAETVSSKNLTRCTLIIDEISQAKGCFDTFDEILTQLRKFRVRPILSAHNWQQIKYFEKNLNDAGLSVILPQGSNKDNFMKMKEEFAHNGFDIDNLLNLDKWNSLNAIQTDKGFTSFISKFPKPVPGKIEDRDDITFEEFKEQILNKIENTKPKSEVKEEVVVNEDKVIKVDFNKKEKDVKEDKDPLVNIENIDDNDFEIIEDEEFEIIEDEGEFEILEKDVDIEDPINFKFNNTQLLLPPPENYTENIM